MSKLSESQIQASLAAVPDWSEVSGAIQRTYSFPTFKESIGFVVRVAEAADAADHHPDILIRYTKVTLTFSTHDAGGITAKDFKGAEVADSLVQPS